MLPALLDRTRRRQLLLASPPNEPLPDPEPKRQDESPEKGESSPNSPIDPYAALFPFADTEAQPPTVGSENQPGDSPEKKPQLPSKSASDPAVEDVEFLRGIGREAQVWATYVKETTEFDDDMVDGWNRSLDVTLVFAALFSAILTAFVLESAKKLEPDREDQTVEILREISRSLQAGGVQPPLTGGSSTSTDAEFHPTHFAVWVNCLWFLSLSLSMAVSLAAMLAKQWCYYYLSGRSGDTITQAEERQKRYGGLAKWRMRGILEHLPMLMHIALALFSVGLILYLWDINVAVASTVSAVSVSALCFYLGTILLPVWDMFCPFKTTQSVYTRVFLDRAARWLHSSQDGGLARPNPTLGMYAQWRTWTARITSPEPFQEFKNWVSSRTSFTSHWTEQANTVRSPTFPTPGPPPDERRHTAINVGPTHDASHAALRPDSPSSAGSDEEAEPFVKDALEWLIYNSQKSASIDTAIGALAIGRVRFEDEGMTRQVNLHLVKHFSDCFSPGREGAKLQLSHHKNALSQALDYVNWMTYFAGHEPSGVTKQVQQFDSTFGTELVTRLGLAFASLADQRTLSVDAGKNVAFWLSSFIQCYDEETIYLTEDILSIIIDGLTIAGRNVTGVQDHRASILAIPQLINILWKVSHIDQSVLRSSIGLNLAVFALTTNIPYSINTHNFKSAADHLAYDYRSLDDRNTSFISFTVFALLGFVHPKSKLGLGNDELDTVTRIIHETRYLARASLSIDLPKLVEYYSLRRRLTSMLVESMIQTPKTSLMPRRHLIWTAYRRTGIARDWIDKPFKSTMHAIYTLIIAHLNEQAVLYDDAIVAATDLLYREVQKLKRLDAAVIGSKAFHQAHSDISTSHGISSTEETTTGLETPEQMASAALALIMEKSTNKQCLETAVRAVLHHTNRCDVGLVVQATKWFANTFKAAQYSEKSITEDQLLHVCGYVRILISMALHCPDPSALAQSLCVQDGVSSNTADYSLVQEKLQLLSTKARDTHVHAFATAGLAVWKFGCPNRTYSAELTQSTLDDVWGLIIKHADHNTRAELLEQAMGHQTHEDVLRPEAIEALVDTTVLFAAVTDPIRTIDFSEAHALLRLLAQFRLDAKEPVRLALAVALTFWGLSLDPDSWEFWTLGERRKWWRVYLQPAQRTKDIAALFLLGLSRILAHYEQLMLNHASIKTISLEIDRYMHQHADRPDTLTLPFLTEYDVRRHVRESVRDYLHKTESDGPFTKSTTMSRNMLRSALQYDGGEGFRYEIPRPFAPRPETDRRVSFSGESMSTETSEAS
ncbi:hypothetical protein FRC12_009079 [Ceratobasidium sp. 428]|nr:hypothetical protein FRC12_009079 [Ceratobasidium sp. 428]